jgi:polyisoprenoid-binding protein YceI
MAWKIDSSHSQIQFTVRHMMISRVRGSFESFSGTVALNEENPNETTVSVSIEADSIRTRDAQRDGHLKSPDFLDVETFPAITFASTKVERTGTKSAKLHGDLTIRDITRPVVLDVEYVGQAKSPWGTISAGFSASTKINRKEWNLTWNQALETGGVLVGEEIAIDIELEMIKQPEAEAEAVAA